MLFFCAAPLGRLKMLPAVSPLRPIWKERKSVKGAARSAQRVDFAFAIVKERLLENLGIIKTAEICSEKNSADFKEIFTIKHIGKIIKEQIFTGLLIIFTII